MKNLNSCQGGLVYSSFSILQIQTFCTDRMTPIRISTPTQEEKTREGFINRVVKGNIDDQLFTREEQFIDRYRLAGFDIRIEVSYREHGEKNPPTIAVLEGYVHVWAAVFFDRTVELSYRFFVPGSHETEISSFCKIDHPLNTDQMIFFAGIVQHVEHWIYNKELDRQEIDGSLKKIEISNFPLDSTSNYHPEGTGERNLTFEEIQRRYRNYFDKTPENQLRTPDHHYVYIDIWEDINHTKGFNLKHVGEADVIEHIETAHQAELVGLMTLYPREWPYRMSSSFNDICGSNIAIDVDDLVLANQNISVVFGTYGRRGSESETNWKEHVRRRSRYHVSWPEYLVLLEIVLAKKQTINFVLDKYINNSLNTSNLNIRDSIEKNAQWSVELSHILLELDSMRYLRYMSHKHMFDMVQKNLRVADDERQLQAIMQQVDKSLDNVNNVVELRHADDTKYILFFISIASLFGVLLQSEDVPIISLISYKFGIGIALVLELLTAVIIVIGLSSFGRATLQYFRRKRDEKRKMK